MPTHVDPQVLKLVRRLDRLEGHVRTLQATPRLRNSSVEGGSLLVHDDAGNLRVVIGEQPDGSTTVQDVGGPPPPRPSAPVVVPGPDGVSITWDGRSDTGALEPWDAALSHVSVRLTTTSGQPGIEVARMTATPSVAYGGATYLAQDPSLTTYITLVSVRRSGVESAPSEEAVAVSAPYVAPVDLDPLNTALDALSDSLTTLQSDLTTLQGELDGAEVDVAANSATLATLTGTTIPTLQANLDAAEANIDIALGKFPVTGPDIAANAIDTNKLAALAVTAAKIAANTITAAQIAADTITANEIAADTITAAQIAANAITTTELAANAVTAAKIAAHTITANEIAADTITANEIAAGAITATEIAADTITANEIASGAITSNELAVGSVTADKLVSGQIEAGKLTIGIATWTPAEGLIVPGSLLVPSPTAQVFTVNGAPTGGTFTLTGNNATTSGIAYNASASTVQTAVRGLGGPFAGAVVSGSAGGPWTVNVGPIFPSQRLSVTSSLTGGTSPSITISYIVASPTFTGGVTATSLTVQKDFNLLGTTNQIAGTLTLANGIVAPTVAPTMFQSWDLVGGHAMPFGSIQYGLCEHLTDSNLLLTAVAFFGTGIDTIVKANGSAGFSLVSGDPGAGSIYRAWANGFNATGGIVAMGGYYYILGYDTNRSNCYYIYKLDTTFNKVSEKQAFTNASRPAIGKDAAGDKLLIAVAGNGSTSDAMVVWETDQATFPSGTWSFPQYHTFPGAQGFNISATGRDVYDFGAGNTKYLFSLENNLNFITDTAGNRNSDVNGFPAAGGGSVRGIWWDGTRFWSLNSDGNLYRHATNIAAETDVATYTWYDGDTSSGSTEHETAESPSATFTRSPRTFLNIQTQEAPDSGVTDATRRDKANRVGIYVGVGAGTRRLQAYNGVDLDGRTIRNLRIDAVNTGSAAWGAKASFAGASGAAGVFQSFAFVSGVSGFQFQGDGSAKLGPVALSAAGVLSGPGFDYQYVTPGSVPQQSIGNTQTDVTGLTTTVSVPSTSAVYEVHAQLDMSVGAGIIGIAVLVTDGTTQPVQMLTISTGGTTGIRQTVHGMWVVTGLAAGNRVFKIAAASGGGSNILVGGQHGNLLVKRIK